MMKTVTLVRRNPHREKTRKRKKMMKRVIKRQTQNKMQRVRTRPHQLISMTQLLIGRLKTRQKSHRMPLSN